jgi:hypothetical protein
MVSGKLGGEKIHPSTAWRRKNGCLTREQKAENQRYLTRQEEQVVLASVRTTLQATGCVRAGEVRKLAGNTKRRRPRNIHDNTVTQPIADPRMNWAHKFLNDHCNELNIRHVRGGVWLVVIGDFVAMPSDFEQLCSKCASINLRLETELSRQSDISRKIHIFQYSSDDTRRTQCKLCRFVEDCAWHWDWPTADKFSLQIHNVDNVLGPTLSRNKVLFSISIENKSSKKEHKG